MKRFHPFSFSPHFGGRRISFKVGVIATLAIAVGANIAVLGNLGVLFGPVVPGASHQNLLAAYYQPMHLKSLSSSEWGVFPEMYKHLAASLAGRADMAMYRRRGGEVSAADGANPVHFPYLRVTPSLVEVLGVQPVAGRNLAPADMKPGAAPVMMVSEGFARKRFGGVDAAVGKTLKFKGKDYRVVGVLPDALEKSPLAAGGWVPFPPHDVKKAGLFGLHAIVRPHPGLSRKAILVALTRARNEVFKGSNGFLKNMKLVPRVETLAQRLYGPVLSRLHFLEIAALLLLILVFANLAGLTTSDALSRRHELATRVALGAGTFRLFVSRAFELGILGVIGWAIGIGLGWVGSRALAGIIGQAGLAATFSAPVLLLTLAAVLVITTILAATGIRRLRAPQALCADLMSGGHTTVGRGLTRALRAFIVLQITVSVVLLVTAGHFRVNVFNLTHNDLGFTPAQRSFFVIGLPRLHHHATEAQYKVYAAKAAAFDRAFLDRLNGTPGVKGAALFSLPPLRPGWTSTTNVSTIPHDPGNGEIINVETVSKHIAPTLGLHVLAGNLNDVFSGNGKAIFLDQAAANHLWPDAKPSEVIGRTLYKGDNPLRIAAVVQSLRMRAYGSIGGTLFVPFGTPLEQIGAPPAFFVHSTLGPKALRNAVATLVHQLSPQAKINQFHSAHELIAQAYNERAHLGYVFGVLAIVALLIAAVGLFALLAYRALVRRPEFAVRSALGATHGRLRLMVMKEAFFLWLVGCVIGIPAAYELGRVLASSQPKLGLPTAATVVVVLAAVAVITAFAALVPARRAAGANAATDLHG